MTTKTPARSYFPHFLLVIVLLCGSLHAQDKTFRAGAYAMDITPLKFPVSSAGSMAHRTADSAHDPLNARCIVLDDGKNKLAIAVSDSCMIPRKVYDDAKKIASKATGIPVSNMLCSATHTHTAVTAGYTFRSLVQEDYLPFLTQRIAQSIIKANQRLAPARIGWAVGNNPNQVFNRRWFMRKGFDLSNPFGKQDKVRMNPPANSEQLLKPAGPIDPDVMVLAVQSADGKTPIAMLSNYSLHYCGGVPGKQLSADYFGEFAKQFAELIDAGPDFVGIMSNGTSGDINNINFFAGRHGKKPFEQIRHVAGDVAQSAKIAYDRIKYHDWVPLKVAETEIELGVRKADAAGLARAEKIVAAVGDKKPRGKDEIYAFETLDMAKYPDTVKVKLQALRIGGLGIASSPCETFVETGLAIKKQSPLRTTFVIELANGYNGYLPTPEQHQLGGYETWRAKSSYLSTDSEPKIRATLLELLNQVAKD
ncbi:MAG: hypothetical protein QM496_21145 [Verrucomicrobiota bacterium]